VFAAAFRKNRFFWFSRREPEDPDAVAGTLLFCAFIKDRAPVMVVLWCCCTAAGTGRDVFNERCVATLLIELSIPA
jgi:hypothetical protein